MTTVVIPTRNEPGIGMIVRPIINHGWDVIVSDCSTDHTADLALAAGAKVVYPEPGLGAAYLGAWDRIDDTDGVVHFDAGSSWYLDDLFDITIGTYADVVIGSRLTEGGEHRGPRRRRALSRGAASVSNFLSWRPKVYDWTSGFRYYSPTARDAIRRHNFRATGHAWQIESLAVCQQAGLLIAELPVTYKSSTSSLTFGRMTEALSVWSWMAFT